MLARADVFCREGGGLGTGERRVGFKGLEVIVLVGDLDRQKAHIVGSHEGDQLLVTHGVGGVGEVLVLIVWSDIRVFFSVYSLLGLEESRTLPSSSNDIQVNSSSL